MSIQFEYFYGSQAEQFSFYRIPKILFTDETLSGISVEAKVLYSFMLDRMSLSVKNCWFDEENRVYIIYTIDDILSDFGCARQKALKLLDELENGIGLIERKRQGLGRPNIIYVKNFIHNPKEKRYENQNTESMNIENQEVLNSNLQKYENQTSRDMKIEIQEVQKSYSNNTNNNYTDFNDTEKNNTESSDTEIISYHKISYDVRFEYNGKYITYLMSPFDKGVNNDCFFRLWSYSDRFDVNRDAAGDSYLFYTSTSDGGRAKVHHMEYVIDLDSKKYDITYTDTSSGYQNTRTGTYTKDMTLDSIRFAVNQNADGWKNGAANGANPGIYWIDNITVEKFGLPEIAAENNDGTITLRADRDVFGVNAYIAGYDSDGKLVSVEKTESFDLSKTGYQITPTKKAAKYGIFVWDMAENKPITMKTEV